MGTKDVLSAMVAAVEADERMFEQGYETAQAAVGPELGGVYGKDPVSNLGGIFRGAESLGRIARETGRQNLNTSPAFACGALAFVFEQQGKLLTNEAAQ